MSDLGVADDRTDALLVKQEVGADEPDGLSDDEVERVLDIEYDALTDAWRDLITRRREMAGAAS